MVAFRGASRYVTANPEICHGKPCFRGTRIPVYLVLEMLEAGESPREILQSYPNLTKSAIQAALHYAAETLKQPTRLG